MTNLRGFRDGGLAIPNETHMQASLTGRVDAIGAHGRWQIKFEFVARSDGMVQGSRSARAAPACGALVPMPANVQVSEAGAMKLAAWILTLK